jgi:trehalose 6-phosphate synthase/phosphatase
MNWISKGGWDFVLAIGDDQTDEDIFAVVPDSAYSIKVGHEPSRAKCNVDSLKEVRKLLQDLEKT